MRDHWVRDELGRFADIPGVGDDAPGSAINSATTPGGSRTSIPAHSDGEYRNSRGETFNESADAILAGKGGTMGAVADGLAKSGMGKSDEAKAVRAREAAQRSANEANASKLTWAKNSPTGEHYTSPPAGSGSQYIASPGLTSGWNLDQYVVTDGGATVTPARVGWFKTLSAAKKAAEAHKSKDN